MPVPVRPNAFSFRAKQQGQKGIKAIILYPMNALAADQEKRFAEAVLKDTALKAAGIRVGNYTGRYDPSDPGPIPEQLFPINYFPNRIQ
jgi:ATP-dependent helicase YprA (DUF1998 family)